MTDQNQNQNREDWLTKATDILLNTVINPALDNAGITPHNPQPTIAVSIGHPKIKKALGECWSTAASECNTINQIFITPHSSDSVRILDVLVHEILHALDDNKHGHRKPFSQMAKVVGLQGKPTATTAGPELKEKLLDIVDVLGDIPHTKLDDTKVNKPKQKTRMIKIACPCSFTFRAPQSQLTTLLAGNAQCGCCGADISDIVIDAIANS